MILPSKAIAVRLIVFLPIWLFSLWCCEDGVSGEHLTKLTIAHGVLVNDNPSFCVVSEMFQIYMARFLVKGVALNKLVFSVLRSSSLNQTSHLMKYHMEYITTTMVSNAASTAVSTTLDTYGGMMPWYRVCPGLEGLAVWWASILQLQSQRQDRVDVQP